MLVDESSPFGAGSPRLRLKKSVAKFDKCRGCRGPKVLELGTMISMFHPVIVQFMWHVVNVFLWLSQLLSGFNVSCEYVSCDVMSSHRCIRKMWGGMSHFHPLPGSLLISTVSRRTQGMSPWAIEQVHLRQLKAPLSIPVGSSSIWVTFMLVHIFRDQLQTWSVLFWVA